MRDYRAAGKSGATSVQEYLERLWEFFRQAWPKLTDDGLACVNLGDKYVDGCLQLIPSRFAIGMLERGWVLLNDITWHKTNGKPESVKCRFTTDSESIYIFAKSKSHYFNRLFEPYRWIRARGIGGWSSRMIVATQSRRSRLDRPRTLVVAGANSARHASSPPRRQGP